MSAPCPNCRGDGVTTERETTLHRCDDEACPVETYDWRGKYAETENAPESDGGRP